MKTIRNLERLQQLHHLIGSECTGSPKNLARRMHISERLVYHLIEQLKDYKAAISYDRKRRTYYYNHEFSLEVSVSVAVCSNNEVTQLIGTRALAS